VVLNLGLSVYIYIEGILQNNDLSNAMHRVYVSEIISINIISVQKD
jgi:hypothetical protein